MVYRIPYPSAIGWKQILWLPRQHAEAAVALQPDNSKALFPLEMSLDHENIMISSQFSQFLDVDL